VDATIATHRIGTREEWLAARDELLDVGIINVGDNGLYSHAGVYLSEPGSRGNGLWQSFGGVGLFE